MNMLYKPAINPATGEVFGTGWLAPMPDLRDYTPQTPDIVMLAEKLGVGVSKGPAKVDLRAWCSPIENQKSLGSCTAHAAVGVLEYFQRRAFAKHVEGSRLFIYKTTRNLMGVSGDTGAWLRNTMGALALLGVPPEKFWPYTDANPAFDQEPSAFVYSVADNYQALKYFCHDPLGKTLQPKDVLNSVKSYLAKGIPAMFGFYGFPSSDKSDTPGAFAYPCSGENAIWGHAVVAVGYDDKVKITNTQCNTSTTGALLIRNSWGTGWGDKGYGWLPYEYVNNRLAMDFWSLISAGWVETGQFDVN